VATVAGTTLRVTFTIPASIQLTAPTPYNVGISGMASSGAAFASSNTASLTINPGALLLTVTPSVGQQGQQNLTVTLTGQLTNFVGGSTQASFGAGIAVGGASEGSYGPVTVINATTATASLTLDPSAAIGTRTVTVQTGVQQVSLTNGFTVQPGNPIITGVSPATGHQGQTLMGVAITGSFTHFTSGTPTVTFSNTGITASSPAVTDNTHLTITVTIAANAATGSSNVTVVTGAETASGTGLFNVTGAPTITLVNPASGQQGQTLPAVTITGSSTHFAAGTTVPNFGTGITVNSTTVTDTTHATVSITIAANAPVGTRTVTMTTGSETATLINGFSVTTAAGPTITDFNPKSAPSGTLVTVTGTNLQPNAGTSAQVTLANQSGGTLIGPVSSANATTLSFVIPAGAATGPLAVTINGQSASAATPLVIVPPSGFTLSALPSTANLIRGQSAAYALSLTSTNGFNQLASLLVAGLPSGITAAFAPQQITGGETSVLTLTAPVGQATGTASLTITASTTVDGLAVTQSATVTLNVQTVTTALLGRTVVSDSPETPLAGVTITMLGLDGNGNTTGCTGATISDGAGNFALTNLSAVCIGPQLVGYNGTTATSPPGTYAGVNLVYTLVSGQATPAPVLIHLPRIDNQETFLVQQNAAVNQSYSWQTIPHLSVMVYAGTTFTMPDGTVPNPFPLTAINVPPDRLPDIKPPVPTMITAFIVAFQPANATTNQPVAVYFPNPLNTAPGMDMALLTLDPTHGAMVPYGTGAVSADGTQIVPDLDPAHSGHRYGLVHFDWHMAGYPPPSGTNPCPICPIAEKGQPVDLSSGLAVVRETDISFGGTRGTIAFERIYRSGAFDLGVSSGVPGSLGPFGHGINHNFGYALATTAPSTASAINLIMPDGNQFLFSKQSNGSFVNSGIPSMEGAVMTVETDNTSVDLRWKDGTIFRFVQIFVVPYLQELLGSITDPNGNTIRIVRSGFGITDIIDPVGRDLHFNLNGNGLITQITAPDGSAVSYAYDDDSGPLRVVTHPDGTTTRYDYNGNEDLTAETDGRGVVVASNTYDSNRRVISQTQANGGVLQFAYSLQNPTAPATSPVMSTTVTDALGHQTVYHFGPTQAVISVTNALGRLLTFGRDGANDVTSITGAATCAACGDSTAGDQTFSYDGDGNCSHRRTPWAIRPVSPTIRPSTKSRP
jgi:YD repeat-containing protein